MEPITLCGLVIVCFGLWVEFEPVVNRVRKTVCGNRFFKELRFGATAQKTVYLRRMPICLAKGFQY